MIRKYHYHKPQTIPWHREEEPLNHHETPGRQIKQSNQLSLPPQDDEPVLTSLQNTWVEELNPMIKEVNWYFVPSNKSGIFPVHFPYLN